MLDQSDIALIRKNRAAILKNRTEPVEITREIPGGKSPVTGQPLPGERVTEVIDVVWKEANATGAEAVLIGGVLLEKDDVRVSFTLDIDVANLLRIKHGGVDYKIVAHDSRGLGGVNRIEAIARRIN